jgi:transaldolase
MRREAEKAREILPWNLVLKIPANDLGFKFTAQYSQYYPIAVTAVYTTAQALVAQACGARYVLFYYGRTNRFLGEGRGLQLARDLVQIAKGSQMEIAAASMKTPQEVTDVALAGVPYLSAPLAVLQALTSHELSDQAVKEFDEKGAGLPAK